MNESKPTSERVPLPVPTDLVDQVADLIALNRNGRHLDETTPGGKGDRRTARKIVELVTAGSWANAPEPDPEA